MNDQEYPVLPDPNISDLPVKKVSVFRKIFGFFAVTLLLAGSVYYYGFHESEDDSQPPTLGEKNQNLQGLFVDHSTKFFKFEASDLANWTQASQNSRDVKEKAVTYYYFTEDTSIDELLDSTYPLPGAKILYGDYVAGADPIVRGDKTTKYPYNVFPKGPWPSSTHEITLEKADEHIIPAYKGFAIISYKGLKIHHDNIRSEFDKPELDVQPAIPVPNDEGEYINSVEFENAVLAGKFTYPVVEEDWVMLPINDTGLIKAVFSAELPNDVKSSIVGDEYSYDYLASLKMKDVIKYAWYQSGENEFKKWNFEDFANDLVYTDGLGTGTYKMMWLKMKKPVVETVLPEEDTYTVTYRANGGEGDVPVDTGLYTLGDEVTVLDVGSLTRDGFNFSGWNTSPTAGQSSTTYDVGDIFYIGSASVVLYAKWTEVAVGTYTVTFVDWDGANLKTQTVDHGDRATAPADPIREGYAFTGWDKDFSEVTSELTVKAEYAINTYNLTYTAGTGGKISVDGVAESTQTQTVEHGGNGLQVTAVADDGYRFVAWSDGASIGATRTDTNVTADIGVTATFAQYITDSYTLQYFAGEGRGTIEGQSSQTVPEGGSGTEVLAIANEGYTFTKWSDDSTGNPRTDEDVSADIAVTAQFTPNTYTVSYNIGSATSGTLPENQTKEHDVTLKLATNSVDLAKTGWSLSGWFGVDAGSRPTFYDLGGDYDKNADVTLYPNFERNRYEVTFDVNCDGGNVDPDSKFVIYEAMVGELPTPVCPGYEFGSWNGISDGTGVNYVYATQVLGHVTIYAQWRPIMYTLTYTAENGGSIDGELTQTINHGESGTSVTAVPETGYVFSKWSDNIATATRTDTNVTDDETFTATFAPIVITASLSSGTPQPGDVESGGTYEYTRAKFTANYEGSSVNGVRLQIEEQGSGNTYSLSNFDNFYSLDVYEVVNGACGADTQPIPRIHEMSDDHEILDVDFGVHSIPVPANSAGVEVCFKLKLKDDAIASVSRLNVTEVSHTASNITDLPIQGHPMTKHALITYTVTYDGNGGTTPSPSSKQFIYGAQVGGLPITTRSGYTFESWNTAQYGGGQNYNSSTLVLEDVTLYAQWTPKTYSVLYSSNGATSGTAPASQPKTHDVDLSLASNDGNLAKTGYTFSGWNTAANGFGIDYAVGATYNANAPLTLYAKWTPITYTLKYTAGDGGSIDGAATQSVNYGGNGDPVTAVPGTGYVFTGWDDGNTIATRTDTNVTSDINVTAQFELKQYTLNYTAGNGGSINGVATQSVSHGGSGLPVTAVPDSGYVFTEWDNNDIDPANPTRTDTNVTASKDIEATFAPIVITASLSSGTPQPGDVESGGTYEYTRAEFTASHEGSRVNGVRLQIEKQGSGNTYSLSNFDNFSQVDVYRVVNEVCGDQANLIGTVGNIPVGSEHLDVGFDDSQVIGLSGIVGVEMCFKLTLKDDATTSVSRLSVMGVYHTASDLDGLPIQGKPMTKPAPITYTVTYDANGGEGNVPVDEGLYNTGAQVTVLSSGDLSKEGYDFLGWETSAEGNGIPYSANSTFAMGDADVVLYAKWDIKTYTVAYNGNGNDSGEVPSSELKTYNVNLPLATNSGGLEKTGHTFSSWNTKANGTGTSYAEGAIYDENENLTLYAKWTPITYTVKYDGNGYNSGILTVPADQTKTYGVPLTLRAAGILSKTGYYFSGWNTVANGSGDQYAGSGTYINNESVMLYAQWTPETYPITYNGNGNTSGEVPADQEKTYGVSLTLRSNSGNLAKTDYIFSGWNTAADGTDASYAVGATYTANVGATLYAQWTPIPYLSVDNRETPASAIFYPSETASLMEIDLIARNANLVVTGVDLVLYDEEDKMITEEYFPHFFDFYWVNSGSQQSTVGIQNSISHTFTSPLNLIKDQVQPLSVKMRVQSGLNFDRKVKLVVNKFRFAGDESVKVEGDSFGNLMELNELIISFLENGSNPKEGIVDPNKTSDYLVFDISNERKPIDLKKICFDLYLYRNDGILKNPSVNNINYLTLKSDNEEFYLPNGDLPSQGNSYCFNKAGVGEKLFTLNKDEKRMLSLKVTFNDNVSTGTIYRFGIPDNSNYLGFSATVVNVLGLPIDGNWQTISSP